MKNSWRKHITLVCLFASIILGSGLAEAKRMGGGRSMGKQSSNVTQQHRQAQTPQQAPTANPAAAAKPKTNWGGILGGAAAGLGLGMLLSHFGGAGMMSGLSNILMIAALAMLGVWLFRKLRGQNKMQTAQPSYAGGTPSPFTNTATPSAATPYARSDFSQMPHAQTFSSASSATTPIALQDSSPQSHLSIPQGFDSETFLRQAKVYFVRLQAAWDAANTEDIREFTSPEMFAEIYADLDAQLLGIEQKSNHHMASVRFSGSLREAAHAEPESFIEVWNLTKPLAGTGGWVLGGIQQL